MMQFLLMLLGIIVGCFISSGHETISENDEAVSCRIEMIIRSDDYDFEFQKNVKPSETTCAVCGQPGNDDVFCAKCDTPHHRECWLYNGGKCSRYGCDSNACNLPY